MDEQAQATVEHQDGAERTAPMRRLGRGLNALLGGGHDEQPVAEREAAPVDDPNVIHIELIERNPYQPRRDFGKDELEELTGSIREHGILQPLLVRPFNGQYQLIAGERRLMAAKEVGLETIPCRVLELEDQQVAEAAIEENIKRKDLNPLEKAQAFQRHLDQWGGTIEELSKKLSMQRSTLSNFLRLLELPEPVKKALINDKITNGHARALLPLEEADQLALCGRICKESLSVRKTEEAVRSILKPETADEAAAAEGESAGQTEEGATIPFEQGVDEHTTNHVRSLEQQLRDQLGAKVEIKLRSKDAGKIVISFDSNDQFEGILGQLRRAA